jgi:glycosyltransferase 2 family protein
VANGGDNGAGAKGQWWRVALRWLVRGLGVALFVGAVVAVGPAKIWDGLRKADPWPLIPAFVLAVVPFIFGKSQRWAGLVHGLGMPRLGVLEAFRLYSIGLWAGQVTPGQAGDFVKAWYLRNRGAALPAALLSCFLDRLFDLVALLVLTGLALVAVANDGRNVGLIAAVRVTPRPIRERLDAIPALHSLATLRLDARHLIPALGWTAATWGLSMVRVYLTFIALDVHLPVADFFLVTMLAGSAGIISVGGLGTRDLVLIAYLTRFGYDGGTALALSFLMLALNLSNIVPGFLLWLREPVPLRQAADPEQPPTERPGATRRTVGLVGDQ